MDDLSDQERSFLSEHVMRGVDVPLPEIPEAPDIDLGGLPLTERPFFDREGLYRPGNAKVGFSTVERQREPQHKLFVEFRERMTMKPPEDFYVESQHGTIGWVPWIGSPVVWPWEAAWEQDLLEGSPSDFRKKDVAK